MASGEAALADLDRSSRTSARAGLTTENVVALVLLVALSIVFVFPFLWTVTSSLKQPYEIFNFPPTLFPAVPQWKNYAIVFQIAPFFRWIVNSVFVVVVGTTGVVLTSSIVAYSFARFKYRGRDAIFLVTLGTMMLPAQITLIPQYVLFAKMGWINTLYPLWVPFWFGGGAFYIFLLRQFFLSLPRELDEAALIDGAGYFRIFWTILMPLCIPALATVMIISFIGSWGDFLSPLIYLNSPDIFTIAMGLFFFQNDPDLGGTPTQHLLMAAAVMTVIPCIILFFAMQRYFIQGVVLAGIKG